MKQSVSTMALQYVLAIVCGLVLLMLHTCVSGGVLALLIPQNASPWELSKSIFWPLVGVKLLQRSALGGGQALLFTLLGVAVTWLVDGGALFLLVWPVCLALGIWPWKKGERWHLFCLICGVCAYILLTYLPLFWGPFLDPRDVAAMATIPY